MRSEQQATCDTTHLYSRALSDHHLTVCRLPASFWCLCACVQGYGGGAIRSVVGNGFANVQLEFYLPNPTSPRWMEGNCGPCASQDNYLYVGQSRYE